MIRWEYLNGVEVGLKDIDQEAEKLYPTDNPKKNMFHDNYGQLSRREAYKLGVSRMEKEITKRDDAIKWLLKVIDNIPIALGKEINDQLDKLKKYYLLNSEQEDKRSVATEADSSTDDDNKRNKI